MTYFKVILKRPFPLQSVCIFYDEDKSKALKEMQKYVKQNGFTVSVGRDRFTIPDVILQEQELTGKILSETSYCELFDINGKAIKEEQ